jgi:hypothetical protein
VSESFAARSRRDRRFNYDSIIRLGEELDRPVGTLLALDPKSDPFFAGRPGRRRGAEWFAGLWQQFEFGPGTHLRRVHYILVSQASPIICPDDAAYTNTDDCWKKLVNASRDARYLGLVPIEHFDDRRNDGVHEYLTCSEQAATLSVDEPNHLSADLSSLRIDSWLGEPPGFNFDPAVVDQRYHVELWAEKTTMNDVLLGLARQYGLNVVTGSGEISVTHCYRLIERAKESGRPVRILYVSDFDPAGMSIPLACARKIELFIRRDHLNLDVQVRPVALTHEQCLDYRLPRTPIKVTERRGSMFEERFGPGATELDALEALHPGELRRLLEAEIARYYDPDLDDRVDEAADHVRDELGAVRDGVLQDHADELAAVRRDHEAIVGEINAALKEIAKRFGERFKKVIGRHNRLHVKIAEELAAGAPNFEEVIDWPEPDDGDEDDDPLFDSTRDYVPQIDRFKRHQDKPIARKPRSDRGRRNGGGP